MNLQPSSIVILGAGLMGRLLAVELARQGHAVEVFDSGGPAAEHAAAPVAAAMLAPLAESAVTEPGVVRMGQYSLPRWREMLGALAQPVFFQQEGTLIVWHRQDAAEAQRLKRLLEATQTTIPDLPAMQVLDGAGVTAAEAADKAQARPAQMSDRTLNTAIPRNPTGPRTTRAGVLLCVRLAAC